MLHAKHFCAVFLCCAARYALFLACKPQRWHKQSPLVNQCLELLPTCPSWPLNCCVQAGLQLEFVYGYAGIDNTCSNLFWTASGKLVYYVAAVGVVYDPETHTQSFFRVS